MRIKECLLIFGFLWVASAGHPIEDKSSKNWKESGKGLPLVDHISTGGLAEKEDISTKKTHEAIKEKGDISSQNWNEGGKEKEHISSKNWNEEGKEKGDISSKNWNEGGKGKEDISLKNWHEGGKKLASVGLVSTGGLAEKGDYDNQGSIGGGYEGGNLNSGDRISLEHSADLKLHDSGHNLVGYKDSSGHSGHDLLLSGHHLTLGDQTGISSDLSGYNGLGSKSVGSSGFITNEYGLGAAIDGTNENWLGAATHGFGTNGDVLDSSGYGLSISRDGLGASGLGIVISSDGFDSIGDGLGVSVDGLSSSGHGLDISGNGLGSSGYGHDSGGFSDGLDNISSIGNAQNSNSEQNYDSNSGNEHSDSLGERESSSAGNSNSDSNSGGDDSQNDYCDSDSQSSSSSSEESESSSGNNTDEVESAENNPNQENSQGVEQGLEQISHGTLEVGTIRYNSQGQIILTGTWQSNTRGNFNQQNLPNEGNQGSSVWSAETGKSGHVDVDTTNTDSKLWKDQAGETSDSKKL